MVCYHLKGADIVLILYDISDTFSTIVIISGFQKVKDWAAKLKKEEVNPLVLYLIGNKTDLQVIDPTLRRVSYEEGKKMAKEIGANFY